MKNLAALVVGCICTFTPLATAETLYVDANLGTGLNDGSSWSNAYRGGNGLQSALQAASASDVIFAANGHYSPPPSPSFALKDGVEIYGSFQGGESSLAERPTVNVPTSILDGFGNSVHVVVAVNVGPSAVLDGFIIQRGNANGTGFGDRGGGLLCSTASPVFRNCHFKQNQAAGTGGAAYLNLGTPTFVDCSFIGNGAPNCVVGSYSGANFIRCRFADNQGAGLYDANGYMRVSNSLFVGNEGGVALYRSSMQIVNTTVVANTLQVGQGAGIASYGQTFNENPKIISCIAWGNLAEGGSQTNPGDQINFTFPTALHNIVQGGYPGVGTLTADPMFVDVAARDYRLAPGSPAIDAGRHVGLAGSYDLKRSPRAVDDPAVSNSGSGDGIPFLDIGALERSIGASDFNCGVLQPPLTATGSTLISDASVRLETYDLPPNQLGYHLMSANTGSLSVASGVLCLGSPFYRFKADVLDSGPTGTMVFQLDFTNLPQGQSFQVGESWWFQLWFRDGSTSRFSSSLCLGWE